MMVVEGINEEGCCKGIGMGSIKPANRTWCITPGQYPLVDEGYCPHHHSDGLRTGDYVKNDIRWLGSMMAFVTTEAGLVVIIFTVSNRVVPFGAGVMTRGCDMGRLVLTLMAHPFTLGIAYQNEKETVVKRIEAMAVTDNTK